MKPNPRFERKSPGYGSLPSTYTLGVMKTITLGYEDETNISKREIAKLQLTEAIALFLIGKYVCAITLSGAAEAVLAGLLSEASQPSVVEDSIDVIQRVRQHTGLAVAAGKKNKEMFNDWNNARNELKHHTMGDDENVTLNLFDEAYWMIKRATVNAAKLGGSDRQPK